MDVFECKDAVSIHRAPVDLRAFQMLVVSVPTLNQIRSAFKQERSVSIGYIPLSIKHGKIVGSEYLEADFGSICIMRDRADVIVFTAHMKGDSSSAKNVLFELTVRKKADDSHMYVIPSLALEV